MAQDPLADLEGKSIGEFIPYISGDAPLNPKLGPGEKKPDLGSK